MAALEAAPVACVDVVLPAGGVPAVAVPWTLCLRRFFRIGIPPVHRVRVSLGPFLAVVAADHPHHLGARDRLHQGVHDLIGGPEGGVEVATGDVTGHLLGLLAR